jgi:hypothetical protein
MNAVPRHSPTSDCSARGWPNRRRGRRRESSRYTSPTRRWSDLIRAGDAVDVLAAAQTESGDDARPKGLASDAVVVLVSEKQKGAATGWCLWHLSAHAAIEVAVAALVQTVTLTFHRCVSPAARAPAS